MKGVDNFGKYDGPDVWLGWDKDAQGISVWKPLESPPGRQLDRNIKLCLSGNRLWGWEVNRSYSGRACPTPDSCNGDVKTSGSACRKFSGTYVCADMNIPHASGPVYRSWTYLNISTGSHGRMVWSYPSSYSGGLEFSSRPTDQLRQPRFLCFSSVPPGKCWNGALNQATAATFHILHNSLFALGLHSHPIIRRY
jgi:hypothetical protein